MFEKFSRLESSVLAIIILILLKILIDGQGKANHEAKEKTPQNPAIEEILRS